jgi:hypothetical protein
MLSGARVVNDDLSGGVMFLMNITDHRGEGASRAVALGVPSGGARVAVTVTPRCVPMVTLVPGGSTRFHDPDDDTGSTFHAFRRCGGAYAMDARG